MADETISEELAMELMKQFDAVSPRLACCEEPFHDLITAGSCCRACKKLSSNMLRRRL